MLTLTVDEAAFKALIIQTVKEALAQHHELLPPLDRLLTIPQAAEYLALTEAHVRRLVHGRPYRAAGKGRPERQAEPAKIPSVTVGGTKGTRVRLSALDAYLNRPAYRQAS